MDYFHYYSSHKDTDFKSDLKSFSKVFDSQKIQTSIYYQDGRYIHIQYRIDIYVHFIIYFGKQRNSVFSFFYFYINKFESSNIKKLYMLFVIDMFVLHWYFDIVYYIIKDFYINIQSDQLAQLFYVCQFMQFVTTAVPRRAPPIEYRRRPHELPLSWVLQKLIPLRFQLSYNYCQKY